LGHAMTDTKAAPAIGEGSTEGSMSNEIARSVGSIWERRCGIRAASISTEIDGNAIRCVIDGGKADGAESGSAGTDSNAYRHEASAAVARITKRTVSAYMDRRDKQTGVATQTFILERIRTKF
jgi:hypothetical protein